MEDKAVYMTVDIESDFTFTKERHYGLFDVPGQFEKFCNFVQKYNIKLTCFVVGNALFDRPEYIRAIEELGVRFGSHSLTHDLENPGSEREVRGGIDTFADYFGYLPEGYRVPRGRVTSSVVKMLESAGILYDSSIYPTYRYNVYSNLDKPVTPFRWRDTNIVELPIGVVPTIRIPLALSYLKVFGKPASSFILNQFGIPENIVFLFHPMDLVYSDLAFRGLSKQWQFAYSVNRRKSWQLLYWIVEKFQAEQYKFKYLHEYYKTAVSSDLSEISLRTL